MVEPDTATKLVVVALVTLILALDFAISGEAHGSVLDSVTRWVPVPAAPVFTDAVTPFT